MVSVLNQKVDGAKPAQEQEGFSLISNEKLLKIYEAMLKCRMIEKRAAELFQQGKLRRALNGSREDGCSAAAVTIDLQSGDMLSIPAGDWLPAFVKGMSLDSLFRSIVDADPDFVAEAKQEDILVAGNDAQQREDVLHCVTAMRSRERNAAVAVFLAPAPASLDMWRNAMTMAAQEKLPIVFVRHTDENALSDAGPAQRARSPKALLHGVPAIAVDAADPVAIYRVAHEAFVRARHGRGATLLECFSGYRLGEVDTGAQQRQPAQVDPVLAMESYLRRKGIDPARHQGHFLEDFRRDMELATRSLDR